LNRPIIAAGLIWIGLIYLSNPTASAQELALESSQRAAREPGLVANDWFDRPGGSWSGAACGSSCGSNQTCGPIFDQRYLSLFGGFTNIDNFEYRFRAGNTVFTNGAGLRSGYGGGAALGGVIKEFVRSEIEFTYRNNSVSSVFNQQENTQGLLLVDDREDADGLVNSYSAMYNVVFNVGKRCVGTPHLYLGGGLGSIYANGDFSTLTDNYAVQDSSFAYQFISGLNYPISDRIDLFTEYRYLGADNLKVENVTTDTSMGAFSFDSHNVFFGVRLIR
jgi:opacity protein-like surface antigen